MVRPSAVVALNHVTATPEHAAARGLPLGEAARERAALRLSLRELKTAQRRDVASTSCATAHRARRGGAPPPSAATPPPSRAPSAPRAGADDGGGGGERALRPNVPPRPRAHSLAGFVEVGQRVPGALSSDPRSARASTLRPPPARTKSPATATPRRRPRSRASEAARTRCSRRRRGSARMTRRRRLADAPPPRRAWRAAPARRAARTRRRGGARAAEEALDRGSEIGVELPSVVERVDVARRRGPGRAPGSRTPRRYTASGYLAAGGLLAASGRSGGSTPPCRCSCRFCSRRGRTRRSAPHIASRPSRRPAAVGEVARDACGGARRTALGVGVVPGGAPRGRARGRRRGGARRTSPAYRPMWRDGGGDPPPRRRRPLTNRR